MAASFVASSLTGSGNSNPTSLTVPASAQAGDLLIAIISDGNVAIIHATCAGWTERAAVAGATVVLTRIATAGDPGTSYSFSLSTGAGRVGGILVYRGLAAGVDDSPDAAVADASTVTSSSLTPSELHDLELQIVGGKNTTTYTATAGFTLRASVRWVLFNGVWVQDRLDYNSTSPTGTITPNGSGEGTHCIHLLFKTELTRTPRAPASNHQNPAVV